MKDLTHRVEEEAATVGLDISWGLPTRHSLAVSASKQASIV